MFDLCRGIDSQDTILRNICPYAYKKHMRNNSANSSGFYIGSTLQKTRQSKCELSFHFGFLFDSASVAVIFSLHPIP